MIDINEHTDNTDAAISCCFSGHRLIKDEVRTRLSENLRIIVSRLYEGGIRRFISGGAIGFDTLAAQAVLEKKQEHPDIRLIMALPCKDQAKNWTQRHVDIYKSILERADEIIYVSDEYTDECMLKRNRFMVDNSSVLVSYLERLRGGTLYTVSYAYDKGLRLINAAADDVESEML